VIVGIGLIWILSMFAEWALWKRVLDNPVTGKVLSALTGYLITVVIVGFTTRAPGAGWNPEAFVYCMVGGVITGVFFYWRGQKIQNENFDYSAQPDLEDTFR
jgi:hypothetical protein